MADAPADAAPVVEAKPQKKRSPNRLVVEEAMNDDNSVTLSALGMEVVVDVSLLLAKRQAEHFAVWCTAIVVSAWRTIPGATCPVSMIFK